MKKKNLISVIGNLITMFAVIIFLISCQNNIDGGNILNIGTEAADTYLKGTIWNSESGSMSFNLYSNEVDIISFSALYKVKDMEVEFDATHIANSMKNITTSQFKTMMEDALNVDILKYKAILKENPNNENAKTDLKETEEELEALKKMSLSEVEKKYANVIGNMKMTGGQLLPIAKFKGVFNEKRTELTIEKCPIIRESGVVTENIVFKKIK